MRNFFEYIFSIFCISINCIFINGQATISYSLQNEIANTKNNLIPVRIEFKNNIDCYLLNQKYKADKYSLKERKQDLFFKLMTASNETQDDVIY